jgi:hypothetical protein
MNAIGAGALWLHYERVVLEPHQESSFMALEFWSLADLCSLDAIGSSPSATDPTSTSLPESTNHVPALDQGGNQRYPTLEETLESLFSRLTQPVGDVFDWVLNKL